MEELSYTSKFDGETTDDILGYANEGKTEKVNEYVKSMNVQDSKGEPDTVQVYDTDGVPHKVSKTELLKKSTLALPVLEDISAFVAVNAAGNAVGLMTKEDIAKVLAELIGIATPQKNGLLSKDGFFPVQDTSPDDANDVNNGIYRINSKSTNYPYENTNGLIVGFTTQNGYLRGQICFTIWPETVYFRTKGDSWGAWKQIGG